MDMEWAVQWIFWSRKIYILRISSTMFTKYHSIMDWHNCSKLSSIPLCPGLWVQGAENSSKHHAVWLWLVETWDTELRLVETEDSCPVIGDWSVGHHAPGGWHAGFSELSCPYSVLLYCPFSPFMEAFQRSCDQPQRGYGPLALLAKV